MPWMGRMDRDTAAEESPERRPGLAGWFGRMVERKRAPGASGSRVLGLMVDAFAGFATLDGRLDAEEADLILDLLRNAFPEADHS